jgi:tungstate transport system permease protein
MALTDILSPSLGEVLNITALSFRVSGLAVAIASLLALPLGALLGLLDFRGKRAVVTLINTLMGLPPVVVGLMLYLALSRSGVLGPLDLLYTPMAMIMAQVIMAIPIIMGLSYSAIAAVPQRLVERTISLGATRGQLIMTIIREARVGILASIVAAFGGAISEVGAIMLVGGNIRYFTRALTTAIVLYTDMGEFSMAITLGAILLVTSFVINLFLTYLQTKDLGTRGPKSPKGVD